MADFLLELFSEEIPAKQQMKVTKSFHQIRTSFMLPTQKYIQHLKVIHTYI